MKIIFSQTTRICRSCEWQLLSDAKESRNDPVPAQNSAALTRLIKRGQESGRADDNEETIKKRLVVYHSQTAPLIDWYKNDGKYCHINGLGSMDGIFADICSAIDKTLIEDMKKRRMRKTSVLEVFSFLFFL